MSVTISVDASAARVLAVPSPKILEPPQRPEWMQCEWRRVWLIGRDICEMASAAGSQCLSTGAIAAH